MRASPEKRKSASSATVLLLLRDGKNPDEIDSVKEWRIQLANDAKHGLSPRVGAGTDAIVLRGTQICDLCPGGSGRSKKSLRSSGSSLRFFFLRRLPPTSSCFQNGKTTAVIRGRFINSNAKISELQDRIECPRSRQRGLVSFLGSELNSSNYSSGGISGTRITRMDGFQGFL